MNVRHLLPASLETHAGTRLRATHRREGQSRKVVESALGAGRHRSALSKEPPHREFGSQGLGYRREILGDSEFTRGMDTEVEHDLTAMNVFVLSQHLGR